MTPDNLIKELSIIYCLKPNRLKHVLGVRDTAIRLGKLHKADLDKLELAALLHDITKYYSKEENIELIINYFDNYEEIINQFNEHILHAFSAYIISKNIYGITDKDVLDPILNHTIGKSNMTIYEKIIFVSDYIEPNRMYDSCVKVRKIAFKDLDLAVYTIIDDSIKHYEKTSGQVPKTAYEARVYYQKLLEERK